MVMLFIVFVTEDDEADKLLSDDMYVPSENAIFVGLLALVALRFASKRATEIVMLLAVAQEKLSVLVSEVGSFTAPDDDAFRKYCESFPPGFM